MRLSSSWGSDDESVDRTTRRQERCRDSKEWSDLDDRSDKEFEEGEIRESKRICSGSNHGEMEKVVEGPALPPGFKKRRNSESASKGSGKRKKKRKKRKKTSSSRGDVSSPKKLSPIISQFLKPDNSDQVIDEPEPQLNHVASSDAVKSRWDSTDEDKEVDKRDRANDSEGTTELPEAPDAIIDKIDNTKTKYNIFSDSDATPGQSSTKGQGSVENRQKRRMSGSSDKSTVPNKKPAVEKSRPKKSVRPSNAARLFEQARNVILKAEKELAAIGYPEAKRALRRGLRRSTSSSSRGSLHRKYKRTHSSYTRTYSRSPSYGDRRRRSRYSSRSQSRSRSRHRRTSSRSRRNSIYRSRRSHSSRKYTRSRSYSRSRSTGSSASESSRSSSRSRSSSSTSKSTSKAASPVKSLKNADCTQLPRKARKNEKGTSKHPAARADESASTNTVAMTAADVRKAEKAKKKKKSTGEKITWQPPLEYGEEENFETTAHKNELKELHGAKVKEEPSNDRISGQLVKDDEIDQMLSNGIDKKPGTHPIQLRNESIFKKRAKMVQHFKKNQEKQKGSEFEVERMSDSQNRSKTTTIKENQIKKDIVKNIWSDDDTPIATVVKDEPLETTTTDVSHTKFKRDGAFKTVDQKQKNTVKAEYRPFRVQQYNLAREESESEESEEDWTPATLKSVKKAITINIKLHGMQDQNITNQINKDEVKNDEGDETKQKNRKRKKKKNKKDCGISLETLGKTLKRCRDKMSISEAKSSATTVKQELEKPGVPQLKPGASGTTLNTEIKVEPTITSSLNTTTYNTSNSAWYAMSNSVNRHPNRAPTPTAMPSRGYNYPYSYHNVSMIRSVAMRYPMHPTMLRHMQANFMALEPPPLPEDEFPERPPEPKQRKKLTDKAVMNLFKKKNISAENLSAILHNDEDVKLPSPARSIEEERRSRRKRSYRSRRYSSSDSYSSSSSSRSRSRERSHRSRSSRSYTRSRSSSRSNYSSYSDTSRHRTRSRSASRSRSSRSRGRTRSRSVTRRSRSSSRDSYDSEYSARSRSYQRSRSRSWSRRRSYYSDSDYSH